MRIIYKLLLVAAAIGSIAVAQAKEGDVIVDVPFGFSAGSRPMHAGRYILARFADGIIGIFDTGNPMNQIYLPVHNTQRGGTQGTSVVFRCYDDTCFIAEIWNDGSHSGRQFYTSTAERAVVAQTTGKSKSQREVALLIRK